MRKVTFVLPDNDTLEDYQIVEMVASTFEIPVDDVVVAKHVPTPPAEELAKEFIASAPTEEPTVEKEIELSKEELDATPQPATQPEGVLVSNQTCDPSVAKRISDDLQGIIDRFNDAFKAWGEGSQCVAELGWSYREGKALEIREITLPIYKKPLPKPDFVQMDRTTKPE